MKKLLLLLPLCLGVLVYCHSQRTHSPEVRTPRSKAIPYVSITADDDIVDDPKRQAQLRIVRNDSLLVESTVGIELRGAMSLQYDKKSYGFELRDSLGKAQELSLLGMPPTKTGYSTAPMPTIRSCATHWPTACLTS